MKKYPITVLITILLFDCGLKKNFQELKVVTSNLPEPKFDKGMEELLGEYKKKYQADAVLISRPFHYSSHDGSSYWLKVEFLNRQDDGREFGEFAKEVAQTTYGHLTNNKDFETLEVSMTSRKGFIFTVTSSRNAFFHRDSLKTLTQRGNISF